MSGESVEVIQASANYARHLTDRIKVAVEATWQLIVEAYQTRSWSALGYSSWDDYCLREFGTSRLQLPREDRTQTVASLKDAGLSSRAIASATGIAQTQVQRELSKVNTNAEELCSPDDQNVSGSNGQLGRDGKIYPAKTKPTCGPPPRARDEDLLGGSDWIEPPGDKPPPKPAPARPQPVMLSLSTHDGQSVPYPKPQARPTFNETTGEGISWAAWSWNPVTGCLHGCDYCYARAIASRWTDAYPAGFTPLFHHERLDAPANTSIPAQHRDDSHDDCTDGDCKTCAYRRVFLCSMADLYGRWVPDEWIERVHASCLESPQWNYIHLTKFPDRYPGLKFAPNSWVGTSVDEQKRVRIAERAFRQVEGVAVKWLSLEPLREPLEFSDLSMFDWVVIGAQTETRQPDGVVPAFRPPAKWVVRITHEALEAGCKVHWKPNLRDRPGMDWLSEFPAPPHVRQAEPGDA